MLSNVYVADSNAPLLDAEGRLQVHPQQVELPPPPEAIAAIRLDFLTPLRLTRNGQTLPHTLLGVREILAALLRRTHALQSLLPQPVLPIDHHALTQAAARLTGDKQLHKHNWTRYSNKQRQRMTVPGWLGRIELRGDIEDLRAWWPLLYLGQWLHLGKLASFGLGQYRLQPHP